VPGYRPPSREPHGKWARAIHQKRRSDGISQTGAFELLGPRLGLGPKSRQSWINLDMGDREPTPKESEVLAEWLGYFPEDSTEGSVASSAADPSDLARLYELLETQARAISQLAQAIAGMPTWTPAQWQAAQEAVAELEAEVRTQAPLPESDPAPSGASPSAARHRGRLPVDAL